MLGPSRAEDQACLRSWIMFGGLSDSRLRSPTKTSPTTKHSTTDGKTYAVFGQAIWNVVANGGSGGRCALHARDQGQPFLPGYNNAALVGIFRRGPTRWASSMPIRRSIMYRPNHDLVETGAGHYDSNGAYKTAYKSGGFDNSGINSAAIPGSESGDLHGIQTGKAKASSWEPRRRCSNISCRELSRYSTQVHRPSGAVLHSAISRFKWSRPVRRRGRRAGIGIRSPRCEWIDAAYRPSTTTMQIHDVRGPVLMRGSSADARVQYSHPTLPFQNLSGVRLGWAQGQPGHWACTTIMAIPRRQRNAR